MKLKILTCDLGPEDLTLQLPIKAKLIRQIPGMDEGNYWLAKVSKPIRWDNKLINYLIVGPHFAGEFFQLGKKKIGVNVAYVIDESIIQDQTLDFNKAEYVAVCIANVVLL